MLLGGAWLPPLPLGLEFDLDFLHFVRFHPSWNRKISAISAKISSISLDLSVFKQFFKQLLGVFFFLIFGVTTIGSSDPI